MLHLATVEACDRKRRSIGITEKRDTQSVSFVRESIGETHARSKSVEARR